MATYSRKSNLIVVGVVALFTLIHLGIVWTGGEYNVFNSPDANANYTFAQRVYRGESVSMHVAPPARAENEYLTTRSTRYVDAHIVPVGFPGLYTLYGFLSRLFFFDLVVYLTALFAAVGAFYFFHLIRSFFGQPIASLSTLLLMVHPAWFMYTYDSLFPNVLFSTLAVATVYHLIKHLRGSSRIHAAAGIIALMCAFMVRASEFIWLLPTLLLIIFLHRRVVPIRKIVFVICVSGVAIVLTYAFMSSLLPNVTLGGYNVSALQKSSSLGALTALLPFGFHPNLIAHNFWNYVVLLFWPFTIGALLSVPAIALGSRRQKKTWMGYLGITAFILVVLTVFYGSWAIQDTPIAGEISISNSHVRYLLPLYALLIVPFAYGILSAFRLLQRASRILIASALAVFLALFLVQAVYVNPNFGIRDRTEILRSYDSVAGWVQSNTSPQSIIITTHADKYLWPARNVFPTRLDKDALDALAALSNIDQVEMYYIDATLTQEKRSRLDTAWESIGLQVGSLTFAERDIGVYRIMKVL